MYKIWKCEKWASSTKAQFNAHKAQFPEKGKKKQAISATFPFYKNEKTQQDDKKKFICTRISEEKQRRNLLVC